jgi:hypothetical protein
MQMKRLNASTSAQRDVCLPRTERSVPKVDRAGVVGLPLRLVNSDRPSRLHRELAKTSDHLAHDNASLFITTVLVLLPLGTRDALSMRSSAHRDIERILFHTLNRPKASIHPSTFRVVLQENHLSTNADSEIRGCRFVTPTTLYDSWVLALWEREFAKFNIVALISELIRCDECDRRRRRYRSRSHTIDPSDRLCMISPEAYLTKSTDEVRIALPHHAR